MRHYIVVFLTSVSSNSHLKMQLHGPWTGSYCRCRGTVPLHAIKHLPEEWQGISSPSPAATPSHWPVLHHGHYQRRSYRVDDTSTATYSPGMFPFSPVKDMMRPQQMKVPPVYHLVLFCVGCCWNEQHPDSTRKAKCRNVCREEWYKIAADKHSLVHLKWCLKKVSVVSTNIQSIKQLEQTKNNT